MVSGALVFLDRLYYFSDGTAWSFTKWKNNAPNNGGGNSEQDCVSMGTTGDWDDVACSTERCRVLASRYPVLVWCAGSTCVRRGTCSRPPPPLLPPAPAAPAGLLSNANNVTFVVLLTHACCHQPGPEQVLQAARQWCQRGELGGGQDPVPGGQRGPRQRHLRAGEHGCVSLEPTRAHQS